MLEYVLGCVTVGLVWYFWPRIRAALGSEAAKVEGEAKSRLDKIGEQL